MYAEPLKMKIASAFGAASSSYDGSARLQRFSGQLIFDLLQQNTRATENSVAVDLGTGTGFFAEHLAGQFGQVIGLDISTSMLAFAKQQRSNNIEWLAGDIHQLPFLDNSIDIIYSNLVIQWCDPLPLVFSEIKRVLKPGGVLVFATLLDGTLFELKQSWSAVNNDQHVIDFKLFNDVEQDLLNSGLTVEHLAQQPVTLEYLNVKHLANELKSLGANHLPKKTNKGLVGKDSWKKMLNAYQEFQFDHGNYPATYQLCTALVRKADV